VPALAGGTQPRRRGWLAGLCHRRAARCVGRIGTEALTTAAAAGAPPSSTQRFTRSASCEGQ